MYEVENANLIRRLSNIIENIQNNKFILHITFEKKSVNIL